MTHTETTPLRELVRQIQSLALAPISYAEGIDRGVRLIEESPLWKALEEISKLDKMTLLGDTDDFDPEDSYQRGVTNAFCEAADLVRDAITVMKGTP